MRRNYLEVTILVSLVALVLAGLIALAARGNKQKPLSLGPGPTPP
jgi:hypothetical protein